MKTKLIELYEDADSYPIDNLSEAFDEVLKNRKAGAAIEECSRLKLLSFLKKLKTEISVFDNEIKIEYLKNLIPKLSKENSKENSNPTLMLALNRASKDFKQFM